MKKLLLACCLGAAVATSAYAEPPRHPNSEERLEHMQKTLQLNADQVKKLKPILEASEQQRKTLAERYKISEMKAFHEEMGKVRESTHSQIAAVLTPPQQAALEAQREHRKGHRFHHRKGGDCDRPDAPHAKH